MSSVKNAAVLVSGGGTNLEALLAAQKDAAKNGVRLNSKITLVVSSSADAYAIIRAKRYRVKTVVLEKGQFSAEDYDSELCRVLVEHGIDIVVLAGFLVILRERVLRRFASRIINIHPSLLPAFGGKGCYGLNVHKKALEAGVKVSGATVHLVSDVIDGGRILAQRCVKVLPGDTPETLQARIMKDCEWVMLHSELEKLAASLLNVAVIGSGAREHCIVRKLRESPRAAKLYALPGNAGMKNDAELVDIKPVDIAGVVKFCKTHNIDYVVVTPDDPLALGMTDALAKAGIKSFGPSKSAARIESSKSFAKQLMKKNKIPTAGFSVFNNAKDAEVYIENYFSGENNSGKKIVVKADGLALGKGVLICDGKEEALAAIATIMKERKFGDAGNQIVIEEFLEGAEASILSFCDGETLYLMASSMDYKRALDGNMGLNTGGMGAVAPNPYWNGEIEKVCMERIFLPTVKAMKKAGAPFSGCLYFGLMLTKNGPFVIEYNSRFGDPETEVVLPLLKTDLLELMLACTNKTLKKIKPLFEDKHSLCVVIASGGYPGHYESGFEIHGIEEAEKIASVYCAGTAETDGRLRSAGGRVLCVSARADTKEEARRVAYEAAEKINFTNSFYRSDIGI